MGVNSATRLAGQVGILGRTSLRYSRSLIPSRRQVSMTDMIAAIRGPASSLPKCSQFLRLWEAFHKRNYGKFRIMQSCRVKKLGFFRAGSMRKYGEVLRVSGSQTRYGYAFISRDVEPPSNGGQRTWHNSFPLRRLAA